MNLLKDPLRTYTLDFFKLIGEIAELVGPYERLILASKLVANNLDRQLYEGVNDDLLEILEGFLFVTRHKKLWTDYNLLTSQSNAIPFIIAYRRLDTLIPARFGHLRESDDILDTSKYDILCNLLARDSTYRIVKLA